MLSSKNIKTTRPMKKLNYKWLGPYMIDHIISQSAYRLKMPPSSFSQVHLVFSVTLLQPHDADPGTECKQHNHPPPLLIFHKGIKEYKVKRILDSQLFCGMIEYLVHWKGYGIEEDEWQLSQMFEV